MAGPDAAVTDALKWLGGQQAANGSFEGRAGPLAVPFKPTLNHDAVFFTALILICLEKAGSADQIIKPAVNFLKSQISSLGSWNYWQRGSTWSTDYPYPDDLDDTACALLALSIHDPDFIDGPLSARLAKLLIANEIRPGGPYRTWLVRPELYPAWGDVDTAVNANIGALLHSQQVKLPALEVFMNEALRAGRLESAYYVGRVPVLYFLSRWYRGAENARLKRLVRLGLQESGANSLHRALLLSAGCRLGLPAAQLHPAYRQLMVSFHKGRWPAEALYADPTIDNIRYYAGSETLTTAFAVEALLGFADYKQPVTGNTPARPVETRAAKQALAQSRSLPAGLRRSYNLAVGEISRRDGQNQITAMATITAGAFGLKIKPATLDRLNLASLNGWTAYSLYDDFFDDEGEPAALATANYAMRQAVASYSAALPGNLIFQQLVHKTFNTMDAANHWEVRNARGSIKDGRLRYKLPAYGRYGRLADRSWGHMLAASGCLVAGGYDPDSTETRQLRLFFRHFLIARQLNDDAHDWQADLERGHLSSAVSLLLGSYKPSGIIDLNTEKPDLQQHFWKVSIMEIGRLITQETGLARRALVKSAMTNPDVFSDWLSALDNAAGQAIAGSTEAGDFIRVWRQD